MELKLDDIKKMSPQMKALCICLIYIIFGYFYYLYFLQGDMDKRSNLQTKLKELEQQVSEKERLASELGKYAKGLDTLKETFKTALTKLPVKEEIPELLNNIALSGENSKVTFLLFEPQPSVKKPISGKNAPDQKGTGQKTPDQKPGDQKPPEQKAGEQKPADKKPGDAKSQSGKQGDAKTQSGKPADDEDYYEEIPVKVTVSGSYHDTAAFFEKVAKLPRIINIEDVSVENDKTGTSARPSLKTSCMIKTYMFIQKAGDKSKKTGEKDGKTDEKKK